MTTLSPTSSASAPPSTGLSVYNVSKSYATPTEPLVVLKDVSFALAPGEKAVIVGPSGSGKSTLLNILGTLDSPSIGRVFLDGVNYASLDAAALAKFRATHVGFVFQDHHLLPQCTALENVLVPKLALGSASRADETRAAELLAQVGLRDRSSHLPSELSGGERQRVAIARALIQSPKLLLCDEPTGNLDTKTGAAVGELLMNLATASGATLVVVTHSQSLAQAFPRKLSMLDGVLLAS